MPLSPPLIRLKIWTGPPLSRCNMCELWGISSWVLQYMEGIKELRCCNTWWGRASKSSDTAIRLQRRLILWANNQRRALMAISWSEYSQCHLGAHWMSNCCVNSKYHPRFLYRTDAWSVMKLELVMWYFAEKFFLIMEAFELPRWMIAKVKH